jgi:Fur family ferric uptake transcriptional regulator
VLTQFETAGLVLRHNFEGGHAVFETASDDHHDHMVCTQTGQVVEFCDPVIEERQQKIADEHGFEIVDHSLILYVKPRKS